MMCHRDILQRCYTVKVIPASCWGCSRGRQVPPWWWWWRGPGPSCSTDALHACPGGQRRVQVEGADANDERWWGLTKGGEGVYDKSRAQDEVG